MSNPGQYCSGYGEYRREQGVAAAAGKGLPDASTVEQKQGQEGGDPNPVIQGLGLNMHTQQSQ